MVFICVCKDMTYFWVVQIFDEKFLEVNKSVNWMVLFRLSSGAVEAVERLGKVFVGNILLIAIIWTWEQTDGIIQQFFFNFFHFFFFASHFQPLVRVKNAPSFPKNCSKQEVFSIEQQCCFRICIIIERGQGWKIYHWGHYFLKQRRLLVQQKATMRMNMLHRIRGVVQYIHTCGWLAPN